MAKSHHSYHRHLHVICTNLTAENRTYTGMLRSDISGRLSVLMFCDKAREQTGNESEYSHTCKIEEITTTAAGKMCEINLGLLPCH